MTEYNWTIAPLVLGTGVVDKSMGLLYRDQGIKMDALSVTHSPCE
jgi:hypothetical protein